MTRLRAQENQALPKGLRMRKGYYSWRDPRDGREYGLGRNARKAIWSAIKSNNAITQAAPSLIERVTDVATPLSADEGSRLARRAFSAARARASKGKLHCMSWAEFEQMWIRSSGRCELTGISFSGARVGGCLRRPWLPSVDRRDSRLGYLFSNSRLICVAANLALNEFGDEVLLTLARGLFSVRRNGKPTGLYIGGEADGNGERA